MSVQTGKDTSFGRFRENLPQAGDVTNDTAGLYDEGNLRVKRRDPWHEANASSKTMAVLALSGQDAEKQFADVS